MKILKIVLPLASALWLVGSSVPAQADPPRRWGGKIERFEHRDIHRWRGGNWRHGWHNGHLGWWWVVGGLWYFYPEPVYPYPDPYRPPIVILPPAEESAPPAATLIAPEPTRPVWYYCESARAYYPYVATCPLGWKSVPAVPPQNSAR